jgi:hypothetical protein
MASTSWSSYVLGAGIFAWVVFVVSRASGENRRTQLPQDQTFPSGSMESMGDNPVTLTDLQKEMVALISSKADAALLNPAFMIALAVTESSLNPSVIGDDGKSIGLFQETLDTAHIWNPDATVDDLLEPTLNVRVALLDFRKMLTDFPGFTYGDYAEAWTEGETGRFKRGRRNPQKVQHLQQAILDLGLTLNVNEVPT